MTTKATPTVDHHPRRGDLLPAPPLTMVTLIPIPFKTKTTKHASVHYQQWTPQPSVAYVKIDARLLAAAIIVPMAIIAMVTTVATHGIIDGAIVKTTELAVTTIAITTGRAKKKEVEDHRHLETNHER